MNKFNSQFSYILDVPNTNQSKRNLHHFLNWLTKHEFFFEPPLTPQWVDEVKSQIEPILYIKKLIIIIFVL